MGFFQQDGKPVEGEFQELQYKNWFEFRKTDNWWAKEQGLDFEIAVRGLNGTDLRFAKILKSVAYIAIDEDEHGNAVLEKWRIKHQWGLLK
jgi:hypothetical protein